MLKIQLEIINYKCGKFGTEETRARKNFINMLLIIKNKFK